MVLLGRADDRIPLLRFAENLNAEDPRLRSTRQTGFYAAEDIVTVGDDDSSDSEESEPGTHGDGGEEDEEDMFTTPIA